MEKKTVYELKGKYTKEEIQRHKFKLNQKHAKPLLLVTSSRYWYKLFCNKPYLFRLHWLLIKTKKNRKGGNELIDIMFDKLHAIHEQNWELAAALRHSELEMEHAFMQRHKINKIDVKYTTVNNGKRNLGIFHVEKQSKKNKNMDARKQPLKNTPDHIEISMLLSDKH